MVSRNMFKQLAVLFCCHIFLFFLFLITVDLFYLKLFLVMAYAKMLSDDCNHFDHKK